MFDVKIENWKTILSIMTPNNDINWGVKINRTCLNNSVNAAWNSKSGPAKFGYPALARYPQNTGGLRYDIRSDMFYKTGTKS